MGKIIAGLALLIAVLTGFAMKESYDWHKWAERHCKVFARTSGDTVIGIGANGQMTTAYIPGKTGYRCDDGMEYWR